MKKIILADQKLNQLVDDITARLMQAAQDRFENGAITGAGIIAFCHHSQVNQFILFRIYQDWNAQISQMVHPYFDFTDAEVKEGLRRFLNILSGHILVRESDFEPLVRQAVYNSLKLILNAEDVIGRFFFLNTEAIAIDLFRKHAPYFSNFDFVIQAILKYHEKNDLAQVERKVFFEKFDRVIELWESKEGRSIAEYQRELFSDLTGKELEVVIGKGAVADEEARNEQLPIENNVAQLPIENSNTQFPADQRSPIEPETAAPVEETPLAPEADEKKKTVIRIRPENIHRPDDKPVEEKQPEQRDSKPTTPPWVETKEEDEEEERTTQPLTGREKSNLPPWVEEEARNTQPPAEDEKGRNTQLSREQQVVNPTPGEETKKENQEGLKPRSLNEAFANRDGKQPSIVERGMEKKESGKTPKIEVRVRTNEPPKQEPQPEEEKPASKEQPRSLLGGSDESDEFGTREARTLAEKLRQQNSPLGSDEEGAKTIKAEQIPVHKQFQYVQKVFGGSSVKFKVVLDKINKTETLEETNEVLDKYVFNDPNVNRNDKVSKEFEAMVRARFKG